MKDLSWKKIVEAQRSEKAAEYEGYMGALRDVLRSNSAEVQLANANFARLKDIQPGTVHQNSTLSNISVQYANEEYIGEQLMPVAVVGKKSDVFYTYNKRDRLGAPDDALGPRGEAAEIADSRSTDSYACVTRGLQNYVDGETLENQDAPLNELLDLTEALSEARAFKREQRIATVMCASGSYDSANTSAIAAGSRWDTAGGGNPIKNIQDAMATIWSGRGPSDLVAWCSLDVYNVLSRHPQVCDLFKYGGSSPGLASPSMIAGFLGLSKLIIGKARQDVANSGITASYTRMWGTDNFGIARVAKRPSLRNACFGYTIQHGQVESSQWFDQRLGKRGGYFAKVAYAEDFKIVANDTAYLYRTVIG
jgi:hypothetical protein